MKQVEGRMADARRAARRAMKTLAQHYGPVTRDGRLEPAHELVFTVLSQHTSDVNSERAFRSLMATFGALEAVADAPVVAVEDAIRMGGLARVKAPRIQAILTRVRELRGSLDLSFLGDMPLDQAKAWLRELPGVGPKTAAVVLCFALGMPAMPVDTHVHRVALRLGLIGPGVTAEAAHDVLEAVVPPGDVYPFHVYLIRHGREVCRAQRPRCDACGLSPMCPSRGLFAGQGRGKARAGDV